MKFFTVLLLAGCFFASQLAAQDVDAGRDIYLDQCATCHGIDAKGQGPMSAILTLQPTDLTKLASTNNDVFPSLRAVRRIDGRDPLVSHGSPMPIFGDYFEGSGAALKTPAGQPILTSQPVVDLIAYLQSVQE